MSQLPEYDYQPSWDIYPTDLCQLYLEYLSKLLSLAAEYPQIFQSINLYLFPDNVSRSDLVIHGQTIQVDLNQRKTLTEIKEIWLEKRARKQKTPTIAHINLNSPFLFRRPFVHDFTSAEPEVVNTTAITQQEVDPYQSILKEINQIISHLVAIAICSLHPNRNIDDCPLADDCQKIT